MLEIHTKGKSMEKLQTSLNVVGTEALQQSVANDLAKSQEKRNAHNQTTASIKELVASGCEDGECPLPEFSKD